MESTSSYINCQTNTHCVPFFKHEKTRGKQQSTYTASLGNQQINVRDNNERRILHYEVINLRPRWSQTIGVRHK
jgi:hypothetical protein